MWEVSGGVHQLFDVVEQGWARNWLRDLLDDLLGRNHACMQGLRASLLEADASGLHLDAPDLAGQVPSSDGEHQEIESIGISCFFGSHKSGQAKNRSSNTYCLRGFSRGAQIPTS